MRYRVDVVTEDDAFSKTFDEEAEAWAFAFEQTRAGATASVEPIEG